MILADAHVHIYDCFDLQRFLESACANFEAEADCHGADGVFSACLLFTEGARDNWFHRLMNYAENGLKIGSQTIHQWVFQGTHESSSLLARREECRELYLIAGRQIVTAEDLEVLALITDRQFEDGKPLEVVIDLVKESGGIPVIPWGFGKWMGKRGRILENTLKEAATPDLFLGDNGGRPSFWPRPAHFMLAETLGIRNLPGSDPLPFASEYWRPGSFGVWVMGSINHKHPGKDLKRILLDPSTVPKPYGQLEKPYRFLGNQLKMQLHKQLRKRKVLSS